MDQHDKGYDQNIERLFGILVKGLLSCTLKVLTVAHMFGETEARARILFARCDRAQCTAQIGAGPMKFVTLPTVANVKPEARRENQCSNRDLHASQNGPQNGPKKDQT